MTNYLRQGGIIFGFTLLGEALNRLIPLPIPAAVYGLVFLFAALCLKIVKLEYVKDLSNFLLTLLPFFFVAPSVNLLETWDILEPQILSIILLVVSSTIIVFAVAGVITQALCRKGDADGSDT